MSAAPPPAYENESAARLAERLAALPQHLRATLATLAALREHTLPLSQPLPQPLSWAAAPIWVTGGGMSEGPARFLCALLSVQGIAATYLPLSEFVAADLSLSSDEPEKSPREPRGTLVLFSQGLAPNARFPLLHRHRFHRCLLVTAVVPAGDEAQPDLASGLSTAAASSLLTMRIAAQAQKNGVEVLTLPPPQEDGLLLRVIGPAVHCLAAAWLAGVPLWQLAAVPSVYEQALATPAATLRHHGELPAIALVASGRYAEACFGLRWKLLEGLHVPDPPIWDLLQVAHGPMQSIWRRAQTLLFLSRAEAPHEAPLAAALAQVFSEPRHRIITLPASRLPGLLAYFEHDALLNPLLLAALASRSPDGAPAEGAIDLISWPGRGHDGPLYNLAPDAGDLVKLDHGSA